jgi:hypothetical protein
MRRMRATSTEEARASRSSGGLAAPIVMAAVAVLAQLPIYDRWFSLLDEGYMLALAEDVRRGFVLYRDVYVDNPLPAAFYVLAGWFGILGSSVWASRVLAVAIFAVFAACVVRIATFVLSRFGVVAVGALLLVYRIWAFPHWQIYSYSSLAVVAITAATAILMDARDRRGALLAAGALIGLATLSKQDYGLTVGAMLGLFLLVRPLLAPVAARRHVGTRAATTFAAGGAVVVLPVLVAFGIAGALPALLEQTVLVPLRGATSGTYPGLPPLIPLFAQDHVLRDGIGSYFPAILLTLRWESIAAGWAYRETARWDVALKLAYYAPLVVSTLAAFAWLPVVGRARAGTTGEEPLARRLLLLAWTGGFLLTLKPPIDWVHLMMIYPPTLLVAAVLIADAGRRVGRPLRIVGAGLAGLAIAGALAASVDLGAELRSANRYHMTRPRGGFWTDERYGPIIADVLDYVAATAPPGAPVPVYPVQPMLDFLAGRETAAGFHVIWPFQAPDRDERIIADLERRHVGTIIYSLSQYAHLGSFRDNAPRLFDYLVDHYDLVATFSRERWGPLLTALARRPPPRSPWLDPAAVLSPRGAGHAARWPFAHVVAVDVGTTDAAPRALLPLQVPRGAPILDFAYGINPDRWLTLLDGPFRFTISVDDTPVFHATLDPMHHLEDRRWAAGSIDLTPWAGRDVTLALGVRGPESLAGDGDLAGFASWDLHDRTEAPRAARATE